MASAGTSETNNKLFTKDKCFTDCETVLTVGQEKTQFYVCMDHLAKLSEYFRAMFFGEFKEKNKKQFEITDETQEDMMCFFNAIDADPNIRKITDDSVELLMRLADKYQCDVLKQELKLYIEVNEPNCKSAATILDWLIWSLKYNMPKETVQVCLPGATCRSLSALNANKEKIGFELYSKLLEAKLQSNFKSTVLCNKNIFIDKCSRNACGAVDSLPYRIVMCKHSPSFPTTYFLCSKCVRIVLNCIYCSCIISGVYDKCRFCQLDHMLSKDKDQCLCARKMYEMLLKEIP